MNATTAFKMYLLAVLLLFQLLQGCLATGRINKRYKLVVGFTSLILNHSPELFGFDNDDANEFFQGHSSAHQERKRRPVKEIFKELGPIYVRRAYIMTEADFWALLCMLHPYLGGTRHTPNSKKRHRNGAKNGLITSATRLSAALRYCAGGSPYDIAVAHGISHSSVFESVWKVVDAVNECNHKYLSVSFPTEHQAQRKIAEGFRRKSQADFACCTGAIDGMLLWTEKPWQSDCDVAQCQPKRFFCGRKKKFGLNLQAVCDHNRLFLDVSIAHPASTSDYLCFTTSPLYHRLESKGFLDSRLCLFGDNAYVNTGYMATPFKAVKQGSKDAYNFYHSQVRINIECAFGMLVNRFAILRRAMPAAVGLCEVTAMAVCLCRLHNFCIHRRRERHKVSEAEFTVDDEDTLPPTMQDHLEMELAGAIPLEVTRDNTASPNQLLHGGDHFDDIDRNQRRQEERLHRRNSGMLPRDKMHEKILEGGFMRPTPKEWQE